MVSLVRKPLRSTAPKCGFFSHAYFPAYEQNCIRIFPYIDKLEDSVHIQEASDTILSMYEKMRITKSRHFKLHYNM